MNKLTLFFILLFCVSLVYGDEAPTGGGGGVEITLGEPETIVCGDEICDIGEDSINCPIDCKTNLDTLLGSNNNLIIIAGMIGLVYFVWQRKKEPSELARELLDLPTEELPKDPVWVDEPKKTVQSEPPKPEPIKEELFYKEI